jgi:hypothetical protein
MEGVKRNREVERVEKAKERMDRKSKNVREESIKYKRKGG